jgi:hypothetical protein
LGETAERSEASGGIKIAEGMRLVGMAVAESPELQARKRKREQRVEM